MRRTSARSDGRLGPRLAAVAASTAVLVATTVPMLAQAAPTGAEESWPEPTVVGELGRGDALFWDGPYLESVGTGTRVVDQGVCESPADTMPACGVGTLLGQPTAIAADVGTVVLDAEDPFCGAEHACFAYAFDVTEPGDVLRVGLDHPSMRDLIFVYLYDPSGAWVGKLTKFRTEIWLDDPAAGRWEARVQVYDGRDTSFRMRAALDPDDRGHGPGRGRGPKKNKTGVLLPNLQVVPPHEFGFGHGLYVVRAAADPDGEVRETRDDDNVAYAYIRVTGDEIEVLERGIGGDPWDPHGAVVDDTRRPIRWTE